MKNVVLILSAAWAIITTAEYAILKEEMQIQAELMSILTLRQIHI